MYDPSVGQFIEEDPIGFDGCDTNLYRYGQPDECHGSERDAPVSALPPTGMIEASIGLQVHFVTARDMGVAGLRPSAMSIGAGLTPTGVIGGSVPPGNLDGSMPLSKFDAYFERLSLGTGAGRSTRRCGRLTVERQRFRRCLWWRKLRCGLGRRLGRAFSLLKARRSGFSSLAVYQGYPLRRYGRQRHQT